MLLHTALCSLLLLTALLDVSTACPLILQPPELVQELGEDTLVNCTTTDDGHRGIYWTYGNETQREDVNSFVAMSILSSDWNTQANCTIKLNDTYECTEELKVKAYKRPRNVTVGSHAPAVEGNQLELECVVHDVAVVQNLSVTWYMNNTEVQTDYNTPMTNTPTNVTSLLKRNVSRAEDGATFTCEASELGPHGPLYVSTNHTWNLSVQYAPEFEENENVQFVNMSDEVHLHCEAVGNPPPHYSWMKGNVTVVNTTNDLTVGPVNENVTFECMASNYLGSVLKKFAVIVKETPPAPTPATPKLSGCPVTLTPDKAVVKFGDTVSANCSTTEPDAEGLGWEATVGGKGLTLVTHLDWKAHVNKWSINASCFLNAGTLQCEKQLNITIWKSPDEVQVSPKSNGSMTEGEPYQLKCDISNVAPAEKLQVKWYQDDKMVKEDRRERFKGPTPTNVTSVLELTPEIEHNGVNFTCVAKLLLGLEPDPEFVSKPLTADVHYKPVLECPQTYSGKEGDLRLDDVPCGARGNPQPTVHWFKDKWVNSTEPLTRRDSGTYTAKFTNSIGDTNATIDISVEYGPSFFCNDHYNVTENVYLGPECEPEGKPKPKSLWMKNGMVIALPKKWNRLDSGQYSITATNKHGQANHTLRISVLYAPRFLEEATQREVNQGGNLTLECSTDGNPPPELRWIKHPPAANVAVTNRGSQSYIHITEATSSNAGLYSCTATNKVGSVSKNVTLTITAGQTRIGNSILFICLVLLLLPLIFVLILIYRNYKKKSGRYDITDRTGSAVPLTTLPLGD